MKPLQALIDGMNAEWQRERAESQMTLGKLIERLGALPAETPIYLADPHSYRGYYCDLAFERPDHPITAAEAIALCRRMMGAVLSGYKGGEYTMGANTPVWLAEWGCTGSKIVSIHDDGTIETVEDDV